MTSRAGIPAGAAIAINDLLDSCAQIQAGQEVLILACLDGLYGGDNLVDEDAIAWIQAGVQARGARASVLWIDEPAVAHAWRFPPVVKGAMLGCDVLINHSLNLVTEEMAEFREFIAEHKKWMVRNFATTAPLLCTAWAQTPYELVSEIRSQSSLAFQPGLRFVLTDENGSHLEGTIEDSSARKAGVPGMTYSSRRREAGYYLPWPEWVHPPVRISGTSGVFIFDCMLSWWSRYIGISPYFTQPVRLEVADNRISTIEGGEEALALRAFLEDMRGRVGDGVYDFNTFHFGVHPQAIVAPHQCPNVLHRRIVEHSHSSCVHVHIGAPPSLPTYPYWMHCTGDTRTPTLKVGDTLVYDQGHLTALDHPVVKAVAAKYPGRPGLDPMPRSF
jgi:hypothetical protein